MQMGADVPVLGLVEAGVARTLRDRPLLFLGQRHDGSTLTSKDQEQQAVEERHGGDGADRVARPRPVRRKEREVESANEDDRATVDDDQGDLGELDPEVETEQGKRHVALR
jgi:hypothetical protein